MATQSDLFYSDGQGLGSVHSSLSDPTADVNPAVDLCLQMMSVAVSVALVVVCVQTVVDDDVAHHKVPDYCSAGSICSRCFGIVTWYVVLEGDNEEVVVAVS